MQGMTYPYSKTSYNVSISRMGNLASKRLYNVAGTYFPTFPPSTLILIPQPLHLVFFCQTNYSTKSESESEVAQSCPTLCDPMDCTLPGSSIHGIFQARILEWVAISFSRKSSRPRDWTQISYIITVETFQNNHFPLLESESVGYPDMSDSLWSHG